MMMLLLVASIVQAPMLLAAPAEGACSSPGGCEGNTRGSALLQFSNTRSIVKDASNVSDTATNTASCNEGSWPDLDHGRTCGRCKVLVNNFKKVYKTCDGYCNRIGRRCVNAWEERWDTCEVLYDMTCDQTIDSSDAICECSADLTQNQKDNARDSAGYGHLSHVAVEEGNSVGSEIRTGSSTDCKRACDENSDCNSFILCRRWYKCWMKDGILTGNEPTKRVEDCQTYYKKASRPTVTLPSQQSVTLPPQQTSKTTSRAAISRQTIKVMSYNTEYKNYNARMGGYANKIKQVAPAIVGLQECQNRDGLARLADFAANKETGRQNYILFDPSKVTFVSGGKMRIPRDNYAERYITWGIFELGGIRFYFFNTHLPHNHNEAWSKSTHADIADKFLKKRRELGAENVPTIVVGDMNSHASDFNRHARGGFESNLRDNGFVWAYTARGHPGYPRIDHILYSEGHWTHSNCRDTGTGGSDHTSITCDLTLTSR